MKNDLTIEDLKILNSIELAEKLYLLSFPNIEMFEDYIFIINRRKYTFLLSELLIYLRDVLNLEMSIELLYSLIDINIFYIQLEELETIKNNYGEKYLPFIIQRKYIEYGKPFPLKSEFINFLFHSMGHQNSYDIFKSEFKSDKEIKEIENLVLFHFNSSKYDIEKYLKQLL